ncbi:GNAT family N-acetyltransferase [Planctomonas psychrotolerans]|uniref:GNAT family N-acetyltransferase n=1 Tax=Planctomonas psychrotolerans TaxID=2528712 RepID=UPI00123C6C9F|nr:GNAT family N-acetyltransferase [Planctomonas psychrotolerans]
MHPPVTRVEWSDPRAVALRTAMDAEMTERYAGRHDDDPDFPAKAARAFGVAADDVVATVLMEEAGSAVAHLAVRRLGDRLEVKKVFVSPEARGRGLSRVLLSEAERIARENGAGSLVLQTGDRQPDAVALYESVGYRRIPIYEPYREIHNSLCFEKRLG